MISATKRYHSLSLTFWLRRNRLRKCDRGSPASAARTAGGTQNLEDIDEVIESLGKLRVSAPSSSVWVEQCFSNCHKLSQFFSSIQNIIPKLTNPIKKYLHLIENFRHECHYNNVHTLSVKHLGSLS